MAAIAFLVPSHLPWYVTALMAAFTVAGLVVTVKDMRRKFSIALVLAALAAPALVYADDDEFVLRDACKTIEKYSAEWYWRRCWLYEDEGDPPAPLVYNPSLNLLNERTTTDSALLPIVGGA